MARRCGHVDRRLAEINASCRYPHDHERLRRRGDGRNVQGAQQTRFFGLERSADGAQARLSRLFWRKRVRVERTIDVKDANRRF
jgi:hypothetical protein